MSELPPTEQVDQTERGFDQKPIDQQLSRLLMSQSNAISAVQAALGSLASAVEAAIQRLRGGQGRLVYAGAGCSIRIGVQDGIELVPTFGWSAARLRYLIAGGLQALGQSVENAEDDTNDGILQVSGAQIGVDDVVIGISASGNTPFTCSVIQSAKACGALTLAVTSNPNSDLAVIAHHAIITETGSEVLAGSTRLGAGTAQKAALNAFSTVLMTNLGRVLGNEMLCVQASSKKLKSRQARILAGNTENLSDHQAYELLESVNWDLRVAFLVSLGLSETEARKEIMAEVPFRQLFAGRDNRSK